LAISLEEIFVIVAFIFFIFFIFLIQQFITWDAVADHGSYFVATYKRRTRHGVKEKKKREKSYSNCLREEEKEKGKLNLRKSYHSKINLEQLEVDCQ